MMINSGFLAYKAVDTIIAFETKSTGIKSAILFLSAWINFITPKLPAKEIPPAAESVSVQPGKGSFCEQAIIEGLSKTTGRSALLLF